MEGKERPINEADTLGWYVVNLIKQANLHRRLVFSAAGQVDLCTHPL